MIINNMNNCKGCNTPQESRFYGTIWLSTDGYCSVCNVKYKDRPRIKSIFEFTLKDVENKHLDSQGRKLTKDRKLLNSIYKKERAINAGVIYNNIKNKRKRKITEFL